MSDADAPAMNIRFIAFSLLALSVGCSSSAAPDAPVIDALDVPATTTSLSLNGQTGPGVILTLSAHDSSAGINALHIVFTETNVDHPVAIPGNPTTIQDQKIELIALGAPSGVHPLSIYVTNVNGANSTAIAKSITVP